MAKKEIKKEEKNLNGEEGAENPNPNVVLDHSLIKEEK